MFKKKLDLQNVNLVIKALEHLTNEVEILDSGEVFGGRSKWDALREFVDKDFEALNPS